MVCLRSDTKPYQSPVTYIRRWIRIDRRKIRHACGYVKLGRLINGMQLSSVIANGLVTLRVLQVIMCLGDNLYPYPLLALCAFALSHFVQGLPIGGTAGYISG